MDGPFFFPGFHLLIAGAFLVFWLVVIAGILWALYFVIRTAVTRGTLAADDIRAGVAPDPRRRHRYAPPPGPRQDEVRPEPPRTDQTPPDVAA